VSYIVETRFFNGWENCWTDGEGKPLIFSSKAEASEEITDLLAEVKAAVAAGDMVEEYARSDYRIVKVKL